MESTKKNLEEKRVVKNISCTETLNRFLKTNRYVISKDKLSASYEPITSTSLRTTI